MKKRKNKKYIDPMFDGHFEKPLSEMTPKEKLDFIWQMIKFKHSIKNIKVVKRNK